MRQHLTEEIRRRLIKQHRTVLKELQYPSGLFAASNKTLKTGYDKAWLRDNFYECLAFEVLRDWETVYQTYRTILRIFLKHETKIDHAIGNKPEHRHQYIHPRYHPLTFDEYWEEWGNKQNDTVGAILFKIAELEEHNLHLLKSKEDFRIVQKLVDYLCTIEYWHDRDSGMWEEDEEVHASSVGACVAGLMRIGKQPSIHVPPGIIDRGLDTLSRLLPRESKKKFVDLALLSLIYPYDVVTKKQREDILSNVEYHLERGMGVIRYKNDHYYNKNEDGYSEEAEWTFGFSWLSIIYSRLGDERRAEHYALKALKTITPQGEIPELYYSQTHDPNENLPLGWSESLFVVAMVMLNTKHGIGE
jgi:phosphorylase kinase alpha/beta subunit